MIDFITPIKLTLFAIFIIMIIHKLLTKPKQKKKEHKK